MTADSYGLKAGMEAEDRAKKDLAAVDLKRKRERLGLTQRQASTVSGIPYGTYIMAETYGTMGKKALKRIQEWNARPDEKDRNKIKTLTRRAKSNA
jgi:hypothetical protein